MRYFLSIIVLFTLVCSATTEAALLTLQYDQVGNLTSGYGKYYEYNDSNQLVKVRKDSSSGTIIAEYFYDYQGQRVKKIENGVTTYYIGKHYEERNTPVSKEQINYYFANGQKVAKKIAEDYGTPKYFYIFNNHLGSAEVITDESGNEVDRLRYYPYGEYRTEGKERHSFTGKERDEVTDNYYFEARYYNPTIRRFTQADTVTPDLYDPQSLNRYAYTRNSPLVYTDPSGHFISAILEKTEKINPIYWESKLLDKVFGTENTWEKDLEWGYENIDPKADIALEGVSDFSAGFGDTITFGGTNWIREKTGDNIWVDKSSGAYTGGKVAGYTLEATSGIIGASKVVVAGASRAASWTVRAGKYKHGGGGVTLLKNGIRKFGTDWHNFKLKGKIRNLPHYHRGKTKNQMKKHRPWQGKL